MVYFEYVPADRVIFASAFALRVFEGGSRSRTVDGERVTEPLWAVEIEARAAGSITIWCVLEEAARNLMWTIRDAFSFAGTAGVRCDDEPGGGFRVEFYGPTTEGEKTDVLL